MFARLLLFVPSLLLAIAGLGSLIGSAFDSDPAAMIGGLVGSVFPLCAGIGGVVVAVRGRASRSTRSSIAAADVLMLFGVAIATIAIVVEPPADADDALGMFVGVIVGGAMVLAALIGLMMVPLRAAPASGDDAVASPTPGGGLLVAGIGSGLAVVLLVGAAGFMFFAGVVAGAVQAATQQAGPTGPAPAERVEAMNFRWTAPDGRWALLPAEAMNPDACIVARRTRPEIMFMAICEEMPSNTMSLDALEEISIANLRSASTSAHVASREDVTVDGVTGRRFTTSAVVDGDAARFVHFVGLHNGVAYQLITVGSASMSQRIEQEADRVLAGFRLIDRDRVVGVSRGLAAPLESAAFGVSLDLQGGGWLPWETLAEDLPSAEFGALRNDSATVAVIPVAFDAPAPPVELTTRSLLAMMDVPYPDPQATAVESIEHDGLAGIRVQTHRQIDDDHFEYRLDVLQGETFAVLIGAWWVRDYGSARQAALAAADAVAFTAPPAGAADPASMTDRQRARHADFHNQIGIGRYERLLYEPALRRFRQAHELVPDDVFYFSNLLDAMGELGLFADAAAETRANAERFADVEAVVLRDAMLHQTIGDLDRACERYGHVFELGFRNDDHLSSYVDALLASRRDGDAETALRRFALRPEGGRARAAWGHVLLARGQTADVMTLINEAAASVPFEVSVVDELAWRLYAAEAYTETVTACDAIIASSAANHETHRLRGLALIGSQQFRKAKTALETALDLAPAVERPSIESPLHYVTDMLGEGSNSLIRTALQPVTIPSELLDAAPDAEWLEQARSGAGCCYELQVRAIDHRAGVSYRETEHVRARLLDRHGRGRLESFQFDFDPNRERMYVNELIVRDRSGTVVHEGNRADWYVLSPAEGEIASARRTLHIPVVALVPGSSVELTVTRERLSPPATLPFIEMMMSWPLPTHRAALLLGGDATGFESRHHDRVRRQPLGSGIAWIIDDAPVFRSEVRQPAAAAFLPSVALAPAGQTWDAIGRDYLTDITERLQPDDATRRLAERIVDGAEDDATKARRIARFVQRELGYRAVAFGPRAWMPQAANDILHSRYGDCKDHALLLHQLLRAAGIDAHLALVNVGGPIRPDLPAMEQFDHMIVHAPTLATTFIDATDKHSDVLAPAPYWLAGRRTLVLDPSGPSLQSIPDYPPDASTITVRRELRLEDDGSTSVLERATMGGFAGAPYRRVFETMDASAWGGVIATWFENDDLNASITSARVRNIADPEQPVEFELSYSIARRCGAPTLELPLFWERTAVHEIRTVRQTPFELVIPVSLDSVSTIHLKSDQTIDEQTLARLTRDGAGTFWDSATHARRTDDGSLIIEIRGARHNGVFEATAFADYVDEAQGVLQPVSEGIAVVTE